VKKTRNKTESRRSKKATVAPPPIVDEDFKGLAELPPDLAVMLGWIARVEGVQPGEVFDRIARDKVAKLYKAHEVEITERQEKLHARNLVDTRGESIAKMTPAERRKLLGKRKEREKLDAEIRELEKRLDELHNESSPTLASARSDLLSIIMAATMLFAQRYYPNCRHAHLSIDAEDRSKVGPPRCAAFPIPVPAK
jgi:hypothetical protein